MTTRADARQRRIPTRVALGLAAVVALSLSSGCLSPASPVSATESSSPATDPNAPWQDVEDRCNVPTAARLTTYDVDGGVLTGAEVGTGDLVAVYLHQTGALGMCGWVPFASWAAEHGVRGLLVDLCGYGPSRCPTDLRDSPRDQVAAVVAAARKSGATTVVLVGASMGASIALGVGQDVGADGVVALSGPPIWDDVPDAVTAARSTTVPLLLAGDDDDGDTNTAVLREAVRVAPARVKEFIETEPGHGYSLLNAAPSNAPEWTPLARTVLAFIQARGD